MNKIEEIKKNLNNLEDSMLSPFATRTRDAIREREESDIIGIRMEFFADADRILHSLSYTRYIDKTQVFSLVPNDHITHRALHVQLVSKIARSIGRLLRLNEDLIEAIAMGHDIGHPPFGHDGETYLSDISKKIGLHTFVHSVQSVRNLQFLEKKCKGLNLTLQVLDGILCHDGETHFTCVKPMRNKSFDTLKAEMQAKQEDRKINLTPMTLEGCVVKMSDVIAYIGRDIEDAIRVGIISREEIPKECAEVLGDTNGKIVYRLVNDLILNSLDKDEVCFSADVSQALSGLKRFNYERIYKNPIIKTEEKKIEWLFSLLFNLYLNDLENNNQSSIIFNEYLKDMPQAYISDTPKPVIVRDFIAGMTDDYFIRQTKNLLFPKELPHKFQINSQ
jgi:dGTPase